LTAAHGDGWGIAGTIAGLGCTLALLAGCSADGYRRWADRSSHRILDRAQDEVRRTRAETQRTPPLPMALPEEAEAGEEDEEERDEGETGEGPDEEPETEWIDLQLALRIAIATNRDYLTRREDLYLSALGLTATRNDFTPQLSSTLNYLFVDSDGAARNQDGSLSFGAVQILPWGGSASVSATTGVNGDEGASARYDTVASIRLTQPLLRGFGRELTYAPLIQAERSLIYDIRDFELFREDFTIQVASRFYDLVQQKQSIENLRRNVDTFVFSREQAEAFFRVGRVNELDVLRARRNELNARNSLLTARQDYLLALDRFKIFLGIEVDRNIDVAGDPPPFVPADFDVDSAVEVAFQNRLDLLNERQRVEDAERNARIAANGILPDLDVTVGSDFAAAPSASLGGDSLDRTSHSVAVSLGLPLERARPRNSYRTSLITVDRARRGLDQFEDNMVVQIRSAFRELNRRFESLEIQRQLIEDQSKNLRIANLRFERGEIPNRDVVEAGQSLLDAENALIREQVNYEIARLQLLRNLGVLFIDEHGMWQ